MATVKARKIRERLEKKATQEKKPRNEKPLAAKLQALMQAVATESVNQHDMIEALMLGIVSGHHVLFIGPPGCNKTGLIDGIVHRIGGAKIFKDTLSKFSEPEVLLGPVSIAALKQDKLKRLHDGYLPDADFAFIGEIFQANSSTLQVLNRILNERQIEEEGKRIDLPLRSVFADTNFFPQQNLAAQYDRFMLRMHTGYLDTNDRDAFNALIALPPADKEPATCITLKELHQAYAEAMCVTIPDSLVDELFEARGKLAGEELKFSDRRWKRCIDVVQAHAYLAGRTKAQLSDLYALRHVLWNHPGDLEKMHTVLDNFKDAVLSATDESLIQQAEELFINAACTDDESLRMDASVQLGKIATRLNGDWVTFVEALEIEIQDLIEEARPAWSQEQVDAFVQKASPVTAAKAEVVDAI